MINITDPNEYTKNTTNGAAYLDKHFPGWERSIDIALLDMGHHRTCVAAQASDINFIDFCIMSFGERPPSIQNALVYYGFTIPYPEKVELESDEDFLEHVEKGFAALDTAWITLLKSRFDSGYLSDI